MFKHISKRDSKIIGGKRIVSFTLIDNSFGCKKENVPFGRPYSPPTPQHRVVYVSYKKELWFGTTTLAIMAVIKHYHNQSLTRNVIEYYKSLNAGLNKIEYDADILGCYNLTEDIEYHKKYLPCIKRYFAGQKK